MKSHSHTLILHSTIPYVSIDFFFIIQFTIVSNEFKILAQLSNLDAKHYGNKLTYVSCNGRNPVARPDVAWYDPTLLGTVFGRAGPWMGKSRPDTARPEYWSDTTVLRRALAGIGVSRAHSAHWTLQSYLCTLASQLLKHRSRYPASHNFNNVFKSLSCSFLNNLFFFAGISFILEYQTTFQS